MAPERPSSPSIEESVVEVEAETVGLKPSSREEQARVCTGSGCGVDVEGIASLRAGVILYWGPIDHRRIFHFTHTYQDWFNAVISARNPDPLFAEVTEVREGRVCLS